MNWTNPSRAADVHPKRLTLSFLLSEGILSAQSGYAQERTLTVGVPAGPALQQVQDLGLLFQSTTGITVQAVRGGSNSGPGKRTMDALIIRGEAPPTGAPARAVLLGDAVLVGSRADRARTRPPRCQGRVQVDGCCPGTLCVE